MKRVIALGGLLGIALALGQTLAAESLESGPQVGQDIPGPFKPLNITGEFAGKKECQVCRNGTNPVAMIFAREISTPLKALVRKMDAATGKNSDKKMGSFVVFCSNEEGLEKNLKDLAAREKLENIVLTIDAPAGPPKYKVAKDADVTVVLYVNALVKSNYAFRKGELKDQDIDKILGDLPKILK
ncbi:MAG: hypothetical protein ACJ8FY_07815 [Gemmataceae bacterium]